MKNHAVMADRLVYTSGTLGLTPDNKLVPGGIKAETEQAMRNVGEVLKAAGSGFDRVVLVTLLLADMDDWDTCMAVYKTFFGGQSQYPARTAFQVGKLPHDARIQVDAVAIQGEVVAGSQSK